MVWLERYKTSTANKILAILNKADADLIEQLTIRLAKIDQRGFDLGKATTKRLASMQKMINEDRAAVFKAMYGENKQEMFDFVAYEADFNANMIEDAAQVAMVRPAASQLRAAVTSEPFRGRLLSEWYSGLEQQAARRIKDAVQIGIVEGQTTEQIVRRIKGTKARRYKDGVLEISRRDTNTVVRTAVAHVQDRASSYVWQENTDIIKGLKWVSTLDGKTSPICRQRDGKIYKVDTAPSIPAHFNCRSRTVPYLGEFKTKGTRSSNGGPVPEDMYYGDWLKKQPKSVQEEVLGVRKSKLFREGGLSIDKFQDSSGRSYTLAELKKRDAGVFDDVFGGNVARSKAQRLAQEAEFKNYVGKKTYPKLRDDLYDSIEKSGVKSGALSEAEMVAVHAYTRGDGYYDRLNEALRTGKADRISSVAPMANVLDNALDKMPKHKGTVYRVTDLPDHVSKSIKQGNVFSDPAFMSTSQKDMGKAFGSQYRFTIFNPKSGRDVKAYSKYSSEDEVLFPRQTKFDILKVDNNADTGFIEVILHEND